jgi:DNA-binding NtrC family response regulator
MSQRILAVDDELHMLELLERIVSDKTPYEIVTTTNSLEVPHLLQHDRFDVIITDLRMPGMNGMDILRLVREQDSGEEVIIITAFGSLESVSEALSLRVFDYIAKPFRREQIILAVDRAMRCQAERREARRLAAIADCEPFVEAERLFRLEYVRRLAERHGRRPHVMAERSGLPAEALATAMQGRGVAVD